MGIFIATSLRANERRKKPSNQQRRITMSNWITLLNVVNQVLGPKRLSIQHPLFVPAYIYIAEDMDEDDENDEDDGKDEDDDGGNDDEKDGENDDGKDEDEKDGENDDNDDEKRWR
jgi:hypothetical protein